MRLKKWQRTIICQGDRPLLGAGAEEGALEQVFLLQPPGFALKVVDEPINAALRQRAGLLEHQADVCLVGFLSKMHMAHFGGYFHSPSIGQVEDGG